MRRVDGKFDALDGAANLALGIGNRLAVQFNMTAMVNDLGTIFANSKKETEAALSENSGDQQEGVKP